MITCRYLCFRQQEFNETCGDFDILTKKYGESVINFFSLKNKIIYSYIVYEEVYDFLYFDFFECLIECTRAFDLQKYTY